MPLDKLAIHAIVPCMIQIALYLLAAGVLVAIAIKAEHVSETHRQERQEALDELKDSIAELSEQMEDLAEDFTSKRQRLARALVDERVPSDPRRRIPKQQPINTNTRG